MSRIGIIGMGWVGSSVAAAILARDLAGELLLNDVRTDLAEGEAMDFAHGEMFYHGARVRAAPLEAMCTADVVVVTAGRGGGPDESRLALLKQNGSIARSIGQALRGMRGVVVVVSNPVDVLTQVLREAAELPPERVFGTGTTLDSARLRKELGDHLGVHSQSVHGHVLGEHGDSELVHWSRVQVGGRLLRDWSGWSGGDEKRIAERVRCAAYEIIRRKGATNHAIGVVTAAIVAAILRDERRALTVSRLQTGALGLYDVALSLPAIVGAGGAERVLEPQLEPDEQRALERSAAVLRTRLVDLQA